MIGDGNMGGKKKSVRIVVSKSDLWSSSFSRAMRAIGHAASNAAIRQASDNGIHISYLKDGVVHKCSPDAKVLE